MGELTAAERLITCGFHQDAYSARTAVPPVRCLKWACQWACVVVYQCRLKGMGSRTSMAFDHNLLTHGVE